MTGDRRATAAVLGSVVAVVAVLLAALVGVEIMRASHHEETSLAAGAPLTNVLAAARSEATTVLSYDYRHLDKDRAAALAVASPSFAKKYRATFDKAVRAPAEKYKAVSDAQVTAAGLVSGGADRAVVLVFVAQTATNSQLSAPRLDRSRIRVTLVRSGGRWLIDDLQPV